MLKIGKKGMKVLWGIAFAMDMMLILVLLVAVVGGIIVHEPRAILIGIGGIAILVIPLMIPSKGG